MEDFNDQKLNYIDNKTKVLKIRRKIYSIIQNKVNILLYCKLIVIIILFS